MSMADIDALGTDPAVDSSGHTTDHGRIHRGLKALKARLDGFLSTHITDSSSTGRTVLTGTASQARTALDVPAVAHTHAWDTSTSKPTPTKITASSAVARTTTTPTVIPGVTTSITSTGTSNLWRVHAYIDAITTVGGIFIYALYVDGAQVLDYYPVDTAAGSRVPVTPEWYVTGLSAGSHTFALYAYAFTTGPNYSIQNRTRMTIIREA